MIEDVKRDEFTRTLGKYGLSDEQIDNLQTEICKLFPNTPDNPDGYEPKPDLTIITTDGWKVGLKEIKEPKPDENDKVVRCQICNQSFNGEGVGFHTRDTGHNKWELLLPKPDEGRLLTPEQQNMAIDRADENFNDDIRADRIMEFSSLSGYISYEVARAQRDLTASILKAECQEKIGGILDEIAEDFVAVVGNLYMTDKNMTLAFELWGQVKKQALKKGEK